MPADISMQRVILMSYDLHLHVLFDPILGFLQTCNVCLKILSHGKRHNIISLTCPHCREKTKLHLLNAQTSAI